MNIPYKAINILLEATEKCNLRCRYCYHADDGYISSNMSEDMFSKICTLTFPYYEQIQFLWHGGEPLCAGLPFYKNIIKIQGEYKRKYPSVKVVNALQTNATLIDEQMACFLVENNFTIGVSFDGTENDKTRGQSDCVLRGIKYLKKAGVKHLGVVTVVSAINIKHLEKDYEYMKELHLSTDYNSLILTGGACHHKEVQLELKTYCDKMKELFNVWFFDKSCEIIINPFQSYVRGILYGMSSVCWHTSCLGRWVNIKPDGTVFPCSREYPERYSFGKIQDVNSVLELFESKAFERLIEESVIRREKCEKYCEWYQYCQGGCSCTALTESGITNNGGFTCKAFREVFSHCYNAVEQAKKQGEDYIKEKINPMIADMLINVL